LQFTLVFGEINKKAGNPRANKNVRPVIEMSLISVRGNIVRWLVAFVHLLYRRCCTR